MSAAMLDAVRRDIMRLALVATACALGVAAVAAVAYNAWLFRQRSVEELEAAAAIVGRSAAPALAANDPDDAHAALQLLRSLPNVLGVAIYTSSGALLASYSAVGEPDRFSRLPDGDGYRAQNGRVTLSQRVVHGQDIVGSVYLEAKDRPYAPLLDYVGVFGLVLAAGLATAGFVAWRLQRGITDPVVDVAAMAERSGAERRRAEQARDRSELRLTTLMSAISKIVWVADERGGFVESDKWTAYTGQSRADWLGFGWHGAFDADGRAALVLVWARALKTREPFDIELKLWHATSGRHRYVQMRAAPVLGPDGVPTEWIGAVQDVDERRALEHSLRTLNAELERRVAARTAELETANKELESFSYSVSHDLRAPIRAIHGFCTLLGQDHGAQLDAEAQRKLGIIRSEAERMGLLIDDLLAFSRLGRKALQRVELDMAALANGAFERLSREQRGAVAFRVGALPSAFGDRSLFEQVWINLLSNALKFSSKKERPSIEVGAISEEHEHVYYVRDNGAGFDPRHQGSLFGVFQRLHHADEFPGTGVGLALVQRIVTRHGGRIWAEAKLGEGATFHFTLPRES